MLAILDSDFGGILYVGVQLNLLIVHLNVIFGQGCRSIFKSGPARD